MNLAANPVQVPLRGGQQVTIRGLRAEDGSALHEFYSALPEEDRLFLRDDVTSDQWLKRFMAKVDYDTMVPLVAEQDGKLIGNATLYRNGYGWTTHVGEIRVVVGQAFQGKGVGTALARELVKIAVNAGIEKMVASVVENQAGARRTFEKLGFRPEAVLKGHVKDIHGTKRDLVIMANDVSHIWKAMEALVRDYSPALE